MPTLNLHISKNKVPRSKIQIDSIRTNREHYFNDLKQYLSTLISKKTSSVLDPDQYSVNKSFTNMLL